MSAPRISSPISRLVRIVIAAALSIAPLVTISDAASAGGWAVASLDSVPAAEPGATTEVSFTILQHGRTPADLDDGVGIEIGGHDGRSSFFPAVRGGTAGHYVATVTFPDAAGTYDWRIQMGWFGPHELGTLDVRTAEGVADSAWSTFRWMTLAGSLLLAGVAVVDVAVGRRRHAAIG